MTERIYTPEQMKAIKAALPPGFAEQLRAEGTGGNPVPQRPDRPRHDRSFAAVSSGLHKRVARPQASVDDRQYVPGALRHWRRVHGLTQAAAQERVGYSPTACAWSHWEQGFAVPPYRTLLKIVLASGLGFWTDPDQLNGVDADLRLEMARNRMPGVADRRRGR